MIEVTYYRKYNRVTITGHAMSQEQDEYGHDMVCSAASILAYTLADRVQNMAAERQVRSPITRLDAGDTEIACNASSHFKSVVTLIFDSICAGWEILAESYPGSVKFLRHEG